MRHLPEIQPTNKGATMTHTPSQTHTGCAVLSHATPGAFRYHSWFMLPNSDCPVLVQSSKVRKNDLKKVPNLGTFCRCFFRGLELFLEKPSASEGWPTHTDRCRLAIRLPRRRLCEGGCPPGLPHGANSSDSGVDSRGPISAKKWRRTGTLHSRSAAGVG